MMRLRANISLTFAAVAGVALLAGCNTLGSGGGDAPPVKPLPSPDQQKALSKQQGGGVDDMTVYPAPQGVKTGLEGGRK